MEVAAGFWASAETAARKKVAESGKNTGLPGRENLIGGLLAIAYDRMSAGFRFTLLHRWVWLPDWHWLVEG